ncbi:hypothetical protein CEXT_483891 [Caerostris extrusa]|uniref:Uncharacterized protein n=1 Tax=Caerostris extrusa TaxID=172846 RepID=A0AAV4SBH9_CAEEX|nr:hypothetical protein CEXT_483891 [Caerostris extrusa]
MNRLNEKNQWETISLVSEFFCPECKVIIKSKRYRSLAFVNLLKCVCSVNLLKMSDYEDLLRFSRKGSFRCRPGCTGACSPADCLAHRQAIQQYESVVQRVVTTDEALKQLRRSMKRFFRAKTMAGGESSTHPGTE